MLTALWRWNSYILWQNQIKWLCYRKWLMLFSLKLQRDNRKNALAVDPAKGKTGKKAIFSPHCGDETTTYITEPMKYLPNFFSKGSSTANGWCFFLKLQRKNQWNAAVIEPAKEKTGKKAVLSPCCEEETGTSYDRAFSKKRCPVWEITPPTFIVPVSANWKPSFL